MRASNVFTGLGYLGTEAPSPVKTLLARILTVCYFGFFVGLYFVSRFEKTKRVPERVTH